MRYSILLLLIFLFQSSQACTVCEKNQPKVLKGITHGAGPQNYWDWIIISIIALLTIITLIYSVKYLINPNEHSKDHIKLSIFNN